MTILLGLGAAITYGSADFIGGLLSRRTSVFSVVLLSQSAGLIELALALALYSGGAASAGDLGYGAAAGVAGGAGITFLYSGLASGRMSIIAPTTAVEAAVIPLLFGLATGERPSPGALAGVVLALAAIGFVSYSGSGEAGRTGGPLRLAGSGMPQALLAGVAFGVFFILLERTGADAGLWPLVSARFASIAVVGAVAVIARRSLRPAPGSFPGILAAGCLDVTANILFLLATRTGLLSLAAVLTSMYPASTVVLARVVLHERMTTLQTTGLGLALAGIALIASG